VPGTSKLSFVSAPVLQTVVHLLCFICSNTFYFQIFFTNASLLKDLFLNIVKLDSGMRICVASMKIKALYRGSNPSDWFPVWKWNNYWFSFSYLFLSNINIWKSCL